MRKVVVRRNPFKEDDQSTVRLSGRRREELRYVNFFMRKRNECKRNRSRDASGRNDVTNVKRYYPIQVRL